VSPSGIRFNKFLNEYTNGSAAQIIEAVDMTAEPCEDFFQFACGSWNKRHIIPEDKTSYNPFEKLNDELQVILKSESACTALQCRHRRRVLLCISSTSFIYWLSDWSQDESIKAVHRRGTNRVFTRWSKHEANVL